MIWPTLINLHPNKCSQDLHYYPFAVSLDRSAENASKIIYHVNANVSLMEENVTWIKCGITISVGVSTKTTGDSVVIYNEIVEETKTIPMKSIQQKLFQQGVLQQKLF